MFEIFCYFNLATKDCGLSPAYFQQGPGALLGSPDSFPFKFFSFYGKDLAVCRCFFYTNEKNLTILNYTKILFLP